MNPVFTFAPHGTRCPAVVVNPRRLTWYYEPRQHFPIFSVRDIPDDLLGGPVDSSKRVRAVAVCCGTASDGRDESSGPQSSFR